MRRKGLTRQSQLAKFADLDASSVSRWLKGQGRPDPASCEKIAEYFDVPLVKVYAVTGHPVPIDFQPEERQPLSLNERILELQHDLPVEVPVYDDLFAAAGEGQHPVIDRIFLPEPYARRDNLFGLIARGYSMEPEIADGDTLIIDPEVTAEDGDIVVASVDDVVLVKRLVKKRDEIVLLGTDGKLYPAQHARVAGVVIWIMRKARRR